MITSNSKSTALVREHHLACKIESLQAQHIEAMGEFYMTIIKKQQVLKKKILIAVIEKDYESESYYKEQYDQLESCNSDLAMLLIDKQLVAYGEESILT